MNLLKLVTRSTLLTLVLSISLQLSASMAHSQERGYHHDSLSENSQSEERGRQSMHFENRLNLTFEQSEKIKLVKEGNKDANKKFRVSKKEYNLKKKEMIEQEFFDENAFRIMQEDHYLQLSEHEIAKAKERHEIMGILSEKQKIKLEKIKGKHGNKKGKRR